MLTDALLDLFQSMIELLLGLLPSGWAPSTGSWNDTATAMAEKAAFTGFWLPWATAGAVAVACLSLWAALQAYSFVVMVLRRLHILG